MSGGALQLAVATVCRVILACAVLHNMAVWARLPDPDMEGNDANLDEAEVEDEQPVENRNGRIVRNGIVNSIFL